VRLRVAAVRRRGTRRADVPSFRLPPPDPNERPDLEPVEEAQLPGPTVIFLKPGADAAQEAVADALLDLRPGLLIVIGDG
jgi:hypothetical protein